MREGVAILILNMLASELGYTIRWSHTSSIDERPLDSFYLENRQGDTQEFSGATKCQDAVKWLRQQL